MQPNAFFPKTIGLIALITLVWGVCLAEDSILELKAPSVLEFSGKAGNKSTMFFFRIYTTQPDLRMEWEESSRLGALVISKQILTHSRDFFRKSLLENGREITAIGSVYMLSQDIFQELLAGRQVKLKLNGLPGWLEKTGTTTFSLADGQIPAIAIRDNSGGHYLFQNSPDFPICLSFSSPYYSEKLSRYYSGSDVIFRWYYHRSKH